jgi:hypothetical protein
VVFTERIGLAHTAIPLEDSIVRSLFCDQIQGTLQRLARRFGTERFSGTPKLGGI